MCCVHIRVWCSLFSVGNKVTTNTTTTTTTTATTTTTIIIISMTRDKPRYPNTSAELALSYIPGMLDNQLNDIVIKLYQAMWEIFEYVCIYTPPKDVSLFGPSLWILDWSVTELFLSCVHSKLGYFAGMFQGFVCFFLGGLPCLESWINNLHPINRSIFWQIVPK